MHSGTAAKDKLENLRLRGPCSTAFRRALMQAQAVGDKPYPISKTKRRALKLLTLQNNKCIICGNKVRIEDVNIHHFIPKSRGGKNTGIYNQTAAHESCNTIKGNSDPTWIEWLRYIFCTRRKLRTEFDLINLWEKFPELKTMDPTQQ